MDRKPRRLARRQRNVGQCGGRFGSGPGADRGLRRHRSRRRCGADRDGLRPGGDPARCHAGWTRSGKLQRRTKSIRSGRSSAIIWLRAIAQLVARGGAGRPPLADLSLHALRHRPGRIFLSRGGRKPARCRSVGEREKKSTKRANPCGCRRRGRSNWDWPGTRWPTSPNSNSSTTWKAK